jgi:non-ribosomal peptide synthetase component F
MLTDAESHSLLIELNNTGADYPAGLRIQQLFEAQVRAGSDRIAVVYENEQLSFRELNRRANGLARHLQGLGVGPQILVGVYLERSLDLLIGLLGVLKAGGAYLPLDSAYPKDRLEFVIQDAGAPVIVTSQGLLDRSPISAANIVCLRSDAFLSNNDEETVSAVGADNAAYVIYTSGTTGKPKGVMLSHRNVINFFRGMDDRIGCDESDTMLALTSISFDISALELFWSMARGAKVISISAFSISPAAIRRITRMKDIVCCSRERSLRIVMALKRCGRLNAISMLLAASSPILQS